MKNPYQALATSSWSQLAELGWCRLKNNPHGDMASWLRAIDNLPDGDGYAQLDRAAPVLGRETQNPEYLREQLLRLHPWRKGPLQLAGIPIDTEWRSDRKWQRLQDELDLANHAVLDIGCGNGYFGLRMLARGARLVVGVDPTLVFVMQWLAMQKLCPNLDNFVLPIGIEDLPDDCQPFDTVFSMGVLYHRRDPIEHLQRLRSLTRPGGQIVLETLILEGDGKSVLEPAGRYARMRNVHAVPSLALLLDWIKQSGLANTRVLDVSRTSTDEQRSTEWMTFESLSECLANPSTTVEGHPAPVRAAVLIRV